MSNKFDGEGFSKAPLEGEEAARHRHMFKDVSKSWVNIDGASTFVNAVKVLASVLKVGGTVLLFAAMVGAWARSQGLI